MSGKLYVCATPIGNLEDAGARLLRVLGEADLIAAEDTRRTRKLMSHFGVAGKVVSYHDANEHVRTSDFVERIRAGAVVALVTDAGTPSISDPGYRLVAACIDAGLAVEVIPGPTAAIAALVVSGLPTDRFAFEGFLPRRPAELRRRLEALAQEERTMIFYESPERVAATLAAFEEVLGDRRVALARELTKVHEEVLRGRVSEVAGIVAQREVLGEVVLVCEGAGQPRATLESAVRDARRLVAEGASKSEAAAAAARTSGVRRREIYESLLEG